MDWSFDGVTHEKGWTMIIAGLAWKEAFVGEMGKEQTASNDTHETRLDTHRS